MATLVVVGVGAALQGSVAAGSAAAVALAVATAAAAVGAAYIDQRYVYPALFGKDSPRNPNTAGLGIDTMTGNDGDPGHRSWGRYALVGGHVLWFENMRVIENRTSSKKGGGATIARRIADIGVGLTRNRIESVESIFADQRVLWRREANNAVWIDHRATIALVGAGARISITATADVQDFSNVLREGSIVTLRNAIGPNNGYYRVHAVLPKGSPSAPFGYLELTPIDGIAAAAGSPGTNVAPMEIRRRDLCLAFEGLAIPSSSTLYPEFAVPGPLPSPHPYLQNGQDVVFSERELIGSAAGKFFRARVPAGLTVLIANTSVSTPPIADGSVWYCERVFRNAAGNRFAWHLSGRGPYTGVDFLPDRWGASTNRMRLEIDGVEGFLEASPGQEIIFYIGTDTELADPDLAAIYGSDNVHGYRGLARFTIRNFNLSNFGDRVPQLSAAVKVADNHSTHDLIRDLMREALGPSVSLDLSALPAEQLLGYTRRGQQSTTTTIQPVAIAYGIESQERGHTWAFFNGANAPIHRLREDELGAYVDRPTLSAFKHSRVQPRDLPRRLMVYYRDPTNDFSRTQKMSRVSSPSNPSVEDVAVDIDPVVLYPWDAQRLVDRLHQEAIVGRDQGQLVLPPSRIDVLNNDRVTFTALNWNDEEATIDTGSILHQTQVGEIEPRSVSLEIVLTNQGTCRVVDNGAGLLDGYPGELFPLHRSVNYATGLVRLELAEEVDRGNSTSAGTTTTLNDSGGGWAVNSLVGKIIVLTNLEYTTWSERSVVTANTGTQVTFSPAMGVATWSGVAYMILDRANIEEGLVHYEFPHPWTMRVQRVTRQRNRLIQLDLVSVRDTFPVVGSPVQTNSPNWQPSVRPAALTWHVLDIPGILPSTVQRAGVFYAACAQRGSQWRGAGVYTSPDNISYSLRAVVGEQSVIGRLQGFGPEQFRSEATSGTTTTLTDSTLSLTTNALVGRRVELLTEDESLVVNTVEVTANTATSITFTPEQGAAIAAGKKYRVMGAMQVAGSASPAVVDGISRVVVALDYGALTTATLDELLRDHGRNAVLLGGEVVQFQTAQHDTVNDTWILSGLIRGRRDTADQIGAHVAGDRFVALENLGESVSGVATGVFDEFEGPGIQGRALWWKIVPNGGNVDDVAGQLIAVHAANVRPFAPAAVVQGSLADWGYDAVLAGQSYDATDWLTADVVVRWFPRSRSVAPEFGAGGAAWQAGLDPVERYLVEVLSNDVVVDSDIVGGTTAGSPQVHRTYRYTLAQQTAAGFASGDAAVIRVTQIGHGGEGGLGRPASISWTVP